MRRRRRSGQCAPSRMRSSSSRRSSTRLEQGRCSRSRTRCEAFEAGVGLHAALRRAAPDAPSAASRCCVRGGRAAGERVRSRSPEEAGVVDLRAYLLERRAELGRAALIDAALPPAVGAQRRGPARGDAPSALSGRQAPAAGPRARGGRGGRCGAASARCRSRSPSSSSTPTRSSTTICPAWTTTTTRRGRPTVHVAYGEATRGARRRRAARGRVLRSRGRSGDRRSGAARCAAPRAISPRAAGSRQLVGGQVDDLVS